MPLEDKIKSLQLLKELYEIYDWLDRSRLYSHDAVNHSVSEYVKRCVHINGAEGPISGSRSFCLCVGVWLSPVLMGIVRQLLFGLIGVFGRLERRFWI